MARTKGAEQTAEAKAEVVEAVKAFSLDWTCRGYQYEVGKTYEHDGEVQACHGGFHACENPLDTFAYYEPGRSRFAVVEMSGEFSRHADDSKIASGRIKIKAEIGIPEIVSRTIAWITARCTPADAKHAEGYRSASSATGYRSASSATGDSSASSATGYRSASSATGDRSASSATGDSSASSATGYRSASSATGDSSASSATGDRSASSATGDSSASSATGDRSASSATGNSSASSATGNSSASSATGNSSASSATGYRSASSASGIAAVAMSIGRFGKARGSEGAAIVIVYHDDDGTLRHIFASKVGENGIKPDVFYTLDADGKPVEVKS
jgi:hypothetical protein